METIDNITLGTIVTTAKLSGCYVETFDRGKIETNAGHIRCLDVIVWPNKETSENDDGSHAVARYTIRA